MLALAASLCCLPALWVIYFEIKSRKTDASAMDQTATYTLAPNDHMIQEIRPRKLRASILGIVFSLIFN